MNIYEILEFLFFPNSNQQKQHIFNSGNKLIHYTSAESFIKILESRKIYMRSVAVMNDSSEIHHGFIELEKALNSPIGKKFLDKAKSILGPAVDDALNTIFLTKEETLRSTFIFCVSEYDEENLTPPLGKLSMWRAYGGKSGIALILNTTAFGKPESRLDLISHPAIYGNHFEIEKDFEETLSRFELIESSIPKNLDHPNLPLAIARYFLAYVICLKHKAFSEEREWRVIAHSAFVNSSKTQVERSIEVIGSIPQPVLKIPLEDDIANGFSGYSPDSLINSVLIGPCSYPNQIYDSVVETMRKAGIKEPEKRVHITNIPLRL